MKAEIERLHKSQEEQMIHASVQGERLQADLSKKLAEKDALIEQCRLAGPVEREAFEAQLAKAKEQIRRAEHDHAEKQRIWSRQMVDKEESLKQLMRKIEEKETRLSRNY